MIASAEMMSGPLPPPGMLQEYETIMLAAANRIFEMAERQSEHRIQLEKAVVNGDSRRSYLGMIAAFILSALVIGGGIYLVATGHDWAGASLIGMNLVGLAGIFVYGSRARSEQLQRSAELVDPDS